MLIMMLAYAQRTGDNAYLDKHWSIIMKWNGYLLDEAKIPEEQLSTDDFAGHLVYVESRASFLIRRANSSTETRPT